MIPDYLEGRLSAADRSIVEKSINQDAEFAAEFRLQKNMRDALQSEVVTDVSDELGWARLKKDMNVSEVSEIIEQPVSGTANDNIRPGRFWRSAAALLFVAVIGQGAFIGTKLQTGNEAQYAAVSEPALESFTLKVGFTADAPLADVTALMTETSGHIIAGPSSLGLYVVGFSSQEDLLGAEAVFKARSEIIETQGRP